MTLSFNHQVLAGVIAAWMPAMALAGGNIALPDPAFAPEGISADAAGNLYIGSLTQGRLAKVSGTTHEVSDFVAAGVNGMVTIVGLHVAGDVVYACSSDPGIGALTGTAAPALVAFDTNTGAPNGRYELPAGGGFCNDITELPDGTILATDSFSPRIYALAPGADQLELWFEDQQFAGEGFNLNGIAYDDGAVYVVRYNTGTLHRIALDDGTVSKVPLPRMVHGADGLNALGDGRFLIVEGGGLSAGARGSLLGITLAGDAAQMDVIAADLDVPTTATVVDGVAYVVEGQLDHLFDPAAGNANPYRILSIDLPAGYR
ncbi:hypothetical protein [Thalassovita sp.]|uniref:hypothetical protein n=1 Tax=Thalassovita sp. TaxID=1979401 RepID=UPI002881620E|nr:hypothetical protein [Thalassovita sp.]MDF1802571.1 hypothetical protein [Thalassovita sp.]